MPFDKTNLSLFILIKQNKKTNQWILITDLRLPEKEGVGKYKKL